MVQNKLSKKLALSDPCVIQSGPWIIATESHPSPLLPNVSELTINENDLLVSLDIAHQMHKKSEKFDNTSEPLDTYAHTCNGAHNKTGCDEHSHCDNLCVAVQIISKEIES